MSRWGKLLRRANTARLATNLLALWKLFRHPETPRLAKVVAIAVLAYAVSPIDLIPDFIPVLGLLDDVILLPLGIALAVKLTPQHLWQARLAEAETGADELPRLLWGAAIVLLIWLVVVTLLAGWLVSLFVAGFNV
ncbi:MAG TPA: YkvA family protein [Burkholderiaceae bacterium]|nr:YkvA family protein [Burkholderiaceae bacterium]